jgi:restriction system protein
MTLAIPDYQSLMLPVLKLAGDGREHRVSDVVDTLASQLKLTDAEREELLPKGKQPIFNNRVHWAKTYLAKAKLLISTRRAISKSQNAADPFWRKMSSGSMPNF